MTCRLQVGRLQVGVFAVAVGLLGMWRADSALAQEASTAPTTVSRPVEATEPYNQGVQLISEEKYKEALAALNQAIAADGTFAEAYIGKGDADIIVVKHGETPFVTAAAPRAEHRWHPSVDRLVSTAMQNLGANRLVGVLMTGMGDDGATAMSRLLSEGGRTIAEAEETAVVWGMPGELVKVGGAEVVAPVDKIATFLVDWAR